MKFNKATAKGLLFAGFLSFLLCVTSSKIHAAPTTIVVDPNRTISKLANNSLGIGLHFAGDNLQAIEPLKDLKVGTLRFATNEFYLFDKAEPNKPKVSVSDPNFSIVEGYAESDGTWWGRLKFDDFMAVSKATNAEPFVVVAIDAIVYTGDAPHATPEEVLQGAIDWVEYANITKKYNVKYWEIGNESDLSSEPHKWTPEQYAETVVKFSQAMKAVDPTIKVGANGMPSGDNSDWWDRVLPIAKDDVDFLVAHQYSWLEDYQEWKNDPWAYDTMTVKAIKAIEKYKPSLRLNITENSSFNADKNVPHQNNTWKMLHNFEMLGHTLRFAKVDYVHFWTSRWLEEDAALHDFSAFDSNYKLMPMGYPLKVWNRFLETNMVFTTRQAGLIRSWASYDPKNQNLSIFLLNKNTAPQNVNITLKNYLRDPYSSQWILEGSAPKSQEVAFKPAGSVEVNNKQIKTQLKPLSVTVIELKNNITKQ